MAHVQTQAEWEEEMAGKILAHVRQEIYLDLRFLGIALYALVPQADSNVQTFATDGTRVAFSTGQLLRVFKSNAPFLDRAYLHTVLHCLFAHLWVAPADVWDKDRNKGCWDVACDIAVEYTIDGLNKPCTRRILSYLREQIYDRLKKEGLGVAAAGIYRVLKQMSDEELSTLAREFYTDDHRYWPRREDGEANRQLAAAAQKKWDKIARQTRLDKEQRGDETADGEELLLRQLAAQRSRRSYREFLQKFAVLKEELHIDPDEFDLNYYSYGLRLYGNMPLLEELESRESRKIREFIIVIDTSDSTSGELVKRFLHETAEILMQSESFFADAVIRILQCDNAVRDDVVIRGERELMRFLNEFTLVGGGSTDFRPAFSYVEELIAQGACKNPGGMVYFTDGKGTYPKRRPQYRTAFVFLEEYDETAVPAWAMRIMLSPEELL